jgi:hypothetical protein
MDNWKSIDSAPRDGTIYKPMSEKIADFTSKLAGQAYQLLLLAIILFQVLVAVVAYYQDHYDKATFHLLLAVAVYSISYKE